MIELGFSCPSSLQGIKVRLTLSHSNEYLNQKLPSTVFLVYVDSVAEWRHGLPDSFLFPLLDSVHFIFSEENTGAVKLGQLCQRKGC